MGRLGGAANRGCLSLSLAVTRSVHTSVVVGGEGAVLLVLLWQSHHGSLQTVQIVHKHGKWIGSSGDDSRLRSHHHGSLLLIGRSRIGSRWWLLLLMMMMLMMIMWRCWGNGIAVLWW